MVESCSFRDVQPLEGVVAAVILEIDMLVEQVSNMCFLRFFFTFLEESPLNYLHHFKIMISYATKLK